jgi:hypothetical protein
MASTVSDGQGALFEKTAPWTPTKAFIDDLSFFIYNYRRAALQKNLQETA